MSNPNTNASELGRSVVEANHDDEIQTFLHKQSRINRMPESELREKFTEQYGSIEDAMNQIEAGLEECRAYAAFPAGQQHPYIGVRPR